MRDECNLAGKLFSLENNDEQRSEYDSRLTEWFNTEIERAYDEVVQKARFLIKLSVPAIFKEAKA